MIIPLYCNRNSKHLSRPYKTYFKKISSQNTEPFLIAEITPNSIHVSEPNQYTMLLRSQEYLEFVKNVYLCMPNQDLVPQIGGTL